MTSSSHSERLEPAIVFREVTKIFSDGKTNVQVLTNLNLLLPRERVLCVLGPSGCGKTTILSLAAGFLAPTTGQVLVKGKPITGPGADRAVVFQRDSVFPWLTVRQNLEYGPRRRGLRRAEWSERVENYLAKVGLTEFADHYPKQLSGGMRKRVDIARAYANQPDVLLMDEPFGPLDVLTKEVMQKELQTLSWNERKSLLFITHDIEEAVFLGDEVIVMTARPAKIAAQITIPFRRPRAVELKLEPSFQALRREIDGLLKGTA